MNNLDFSSNLTGWTTRNASGHTISATGGTLTLNTTLPDRGIYQVIASEDKGRRVNFTANQTSGSVILSVLGPDYRSVRWNRYTPATTTDVYALSPTWSWDDVQLFRGAWVCEAPNGDLLCPALCIRYPNLSDYPYQATITLMRKTSTDATFSVPSSQFSALVNNPLGGASGGYQWTAHNLRLYRSKVYTSLLYATWNELKCYVDGTGPNCFGYDCSAGSCESHIYMAVSSDSGVTWSTPVAVVDSSDFDTGNFVLETRPFFYEVDHGSGSSSIYFPFYTALAEGVEGSILYTVKVDISANGLTIESASTVDYLEHTVGLGTGQSETDGILNELEPAITEDATYIYSWSRQWGSEAALDFIVTKKCTKATGLFDNWDSPTEAIFYTAYPLATLKLSSGNYLVAINNGGGNNESNLLLLEFSDAALTTCIWGEVIDAKYCHHVTLTEMADGRIVLGYDTQTNRDDWTYKRFKSINVLISKDTWANHKNGAQTATMVTGANVELTCDIPHYAPDGSMLWITTGIGKTSNLTMTGQGVCSSYTPPDTEGYLI